MTDDDCCKGPFKNMTEDDDDCWCFKGPFKNISFVSAQDTCFLTVLSMIESMGTK